jgi:hypothetical protein
MRRHAGRVDGPCGGAGDDDFAAWAHEWAPEILHDRYEHLNPQHAPQQAFDGSRKQQTPQASSDKNYQTHKTVISQLGILETKIINRMVNKIKNVNKVFISRHN